MSSLFGDSDAVEFLNGNGDDNLPSDNEQDGNLFGDDNEDGDGGGDSQDKPIKVEPKKRSVRNPRPRLTVETLRGPRGIHTIEDYYKDMKFRGRGYEKHDLDEVMRRLQHWGHRMYPTYKFDDVLNNIERLGKKKPLQVHMSRYRLGMLENLRALADGEVHGEDGDALEGGAGGDNEDEPFDEFDALLGEQIAISKLAPRTPGPNASRAVAHHNTSAVSSSTFATPSFSRGNAVMSTPYTGAHNKLNDTSDYAQPLPTSQPPTPVAKKLTAEQMARIAENRRIAQERLRAKKLQMQQQQPQTIDEVS